MTILRRFRRHKCKEKHTLTLTLTSAPQTSPLTLPHPPETSPKPNLSRASASSRLPLPPKEGGIRSIKLVDLPPEVLDEIISYLDLPTSTLLSFCNTTLRQYPALELNYASIRTSPKFTKERATFLSLFLYHNADIGVCWECGTVYNYHSLRGIGDPERLRARELFRKYMFKDIQHTRCTVSHFIFSIMSTYRVSFDDIFLIMKRYRLGIKDATKHFQHLEVGHHPKFNISVVTSADAVVGGPEDDLLHRAQVWIGAKMLMVDRKSLKRLFTLLLGTLCLHNGATLRRGLCLERLSEGLVLEMETKMLKIVLNNPPRPREERGKGVGTWKFEWCKLSECGFCHTEYKLQWMRGGSNLGMIMGITAWRNLGKGTDDMEYKFRLRQTGMGPFEKEGRSVRKDYEAREEESNQSLSERNIDLVSHHIHGNRWDAHLPKSIYRKGPHDRPYLESWYESPNDDPLRYQYVRGIWRENGSEYGGIESYDIREEDRCS